LIGNMEKETRPLWKLLLLAHESKKELQITYEECFTLLEFDADCLAAGADPAEIRSIVNSHLALCSSRSIQFDDWLESLEDSLAHDHTEQ